MPEISFANVVKRYGKVVAVDDLSFTIHDGEYLGLLGPSGCGKTTTLRMISGLIKPTSGNILWDGKSMEKLDPQDRDIGYVFQHFAIFPHLTIQENIAFGAIARGLAPRDVEAVVEEYSKVVGLQDKLDQYAKNLDAPDLQRVGLARVLAKGAKTLLLDEPLGALDHKIRERFQDELLRLVKDLNLTAIHVTHDQNEAMAISDRIGVMKKGKMIQVGTPNDLLFEPREIFTSHFIGESDFLEGVIIKSTGTHNEILVLGDSILQVPMSIPAPSMYEEVVVGIRREFFEILPLKADEKKRDLPPNFIHGTVITDRFVGEKRRTFIRLRYGRSIEVKRRPNGRPFKRGDDIKIYIHPNAVVVFNQPHQNLEREMEVT
ncbi:MAG: ABC transporter ATP-binding protein [Candidatus Kariarchaeaceae archaeon]|jgi:ABC-type Fe3+/spermidine/putrescine transport system ATPase subunit